MTRKAILAIAVLALAEPGISAERSAQYESEKEEMTQSVNILGECAGYFEFLSDVKEKTDPGAKASITYMQDLARGAKMAASYMLYLEYYSKPENKGKKKTIGEFFNYPDNRSATERTRIMALAENGKQDEIKAIGSMCNEVAKAQEQILQQMRDDIAER